MNGKLQETLIFGLLFVSGDEGLTIFDIKRVLEISAEDIRKIIDVMSKNFAEDEFQALQLVEYGQKFKLVTKVEHAKWYTKLGNVKTRNPLRPAVMEALAIIAYNQPCTKKKIDEIRGTNNVSTIDSLLNHGLIVEAGREETPGNPFLYEVTQKFYDIFGIKSIKDLPTMKESSSLLAAEDFFDTIREEDVKSYVD